MDGQFRIQAISSQHLWVDRPVSASLPPVSNHFRCLSTALNKDLKI